MKKIEMLCYGIKHIAENHRLEADVEFEETGEVCIFGGNNIPTEMDVRMLCADLGIPEDNIESGDCGIDVFIPEDWDGNAEYVTGLEFWRRLS